jgi:dihydrodipicolinate synthase/N-acetylneuraminate lyase
MTRIEKKYRGVIVPMVTPVDANQNIDVEAVKPLWSCLCRMVLLRFCWVPRASRFRLRKQRNASWWHATVKAVGKRSIVYAGISSNCLEEAIETGKAFADLGADVLVAHQPYYFPMNDDQMLVWFEQMANSLPVPLILYNNPITTKQSVPLSVIEKLSYHPNIVGFKDSERGMERLDEAIALWKNRADFSHLLGWAAQSAYSVLNGSDGIIPARATLSQLPIKHFTMPHWQAMPMRPTVCRMSPTVFPKFTKRTVTSTTQYLH